MGLASEQEAKQVAEMAARYPEVKAELEAVEASMEKFDKQNEVEPPAHVKTKILSQIGSTVQGSTVQGSPSAVPGAEERGKVRSLNDTVDTAQKQSSFFKYAAAVVFVLLVGSGIYILTLSSRIDEVETELTSTKMALNEMRVSDSMMTIMNEQLTAANQQLEILKKPSMKAVELKGMEAAPDAKAMAYANVSTGEVYLEIMNLPAAPEGMQYQFWGIVDGKPVDAGMIPLDDTTGIHAMTTVKNAVAYAISLEPKGGSQQPQGKIYVMGNS